MHTPFTFKQFALLAGKAARALAAMVGLTPARLDLLQLLLGGELAQRDIGALLCVCPSVVARIVKALLAMGLVKRRTPDEDRRLRLVSITSRGESVLAETFEESPPHEYGYSVQDAAERTLRCDFQEHLTARRVTFDTASNDNHAALVYGMYRYVRRHDYFYEWSGVPTRYIRARGLATLATILAKAA